VPVPSPTWRHPSWHADGPALLRLLCHKNRERYVKCRAMDWEEREFRNNKTVTQSGCADPSSTLFLPAVPSTTTGLVNPIKAAGVFQQTQMFLCGPHACFGEVMMACSSMLSIWRWVKYAHWSLTCVTDWSRKSGNSFCVSMLGRFRFTSCSYARKSAYNCLDNSGILSTPMPKGFLRATQSPAFSTASRDSIA